MTLDLKKIRELAEALGGHEWYVLGPPWQGYADNFTILRGSPDPHVGKAILITETIEDDDETDDHYRQEALAQWLEFVDPNTTIALVEEVEKLREGLAALPFPPAEGGL